MRQLAHRCIIFLAAALLVIATVDGQQKNAGKASRRKAQAERDYKKAYAKARERTIKHRYAIQTHATRDMMDEAGKRAATFNRQDEPTRLQRIFKRKRPKN